MNSSHDISADIIAQLIASYQQPELPTSSVKMVKVSGAPTKKMGKLAIAKAAKEVAQQTTSERAEGDCRVQQAVVVSIPLPPCGTFTAKEYIVGMRRAVNRNDRIRFIAGYTGFDTTLSYSANELNANMSAKRTLYGAVVALPRPVHSAPTAATLSGYVAGCHDAAAKKKADLQGRAVYTAEAMIDYNKQALEALDRNDQANAAHYATMAHLEADRLTQIRRDMETL
jgi:hypothetical protein